MVVAVAGMPGLEVAATSGLEVAAASGSSLDAEVAARSEVAAGSEVVGAAAAGSLGSGSGSMTTGSMTTGSIVGGPAAAPGERAACAKGRCYWLPCQAASARRSQIEALRGAVRNRWHLLVMSGRTDCKSGLVERLLGGQIGNLDILEQLGNEQAIARIAASVVLHLIQGRGVHDNATHRRDHRRKAG